MNRNLRRYDIYILILTVIALVFLSYIESNKSLVKDPLYEEKYKASRLMEDYSHKIRKEKNKRGIEIDSEIDRNMTGLIGSEMNGITTTLGSIESKRTSTNPNFAAVMIDMMKQAGLRLGDNVAINFSSSFPALNLSTLAACEVLDLNPIIITSIGSSTWGGNNLEFTYLDMEEFLYNEGLLSHKSTVVSPGGSGDIGKDMNQEDLNSILNRMKLYNKTIIIEEDLEKNIGLRKEIYFKDSNSIKAFINIGGNIVAFGDTTDSIDAPTGLIENKYYDTNEKTGLVQFFNSKNIPVIHMLNINELANRYGLPVDPSTPFIIGDGDVYYTYSYPLGLIYLVLIGIICFLIILKKRTIRNYED